MSKQQLKYLRLILLFMFLTNLQSLFAQQIYLTWKADENLEISFYNIYRKNTAESAFTYINSVSYPDTFYNDETVPDSSSLIYTVTAVDQFGNESGFSNTVEVLTSPTPVELSHFSGYVKNRHAVLEWTTATESNNYGFEIQRNAENNFSFEKIGFVQGNGTSSMPNQYSFVDLNRAAGNYFYRLKQIDFNGEFSFSEVVEISIGVVDDFRLFQNYPNPFNSITTISYSLPNSSNVEVKIFNMRGQLVKELANEFQQAGQHNIDWNGTNLAGANVTSGVYICKISTLTTTKIFSLALIN